MDKPNVLREKSYAFAVSVSRFCLKIIKEQKEFVMTRQLLKSGTSIGANIEEAQRAQTKPDFISKMSIAHKEAAETDYWLRLMGDTLPVSAGEIKNFRKNVDELLRLLTTIIKKSKAQ